MTGPVFPVPVSRRAALVRIGAGGVAAALAARGLAATAQEASPAASPGAVPPVLQDWVAGWEAADADRIAGSYAEDALVEVVAFNITLRGLDEIRGFFTAYFAAFAEPNPTITAVFATADRAAAEWSFEGQYTGQLVGLPPGTGQPVSVRGANVMTLTGDRIAEERIYNDLAGILVQLGIAAAPGAAGTPAAATPEG